MPASAAAGVMVTFMILMATAFSLTRAHSWGSSLSQARAREAAVQYLELARHDVETALAVWSELDTRVQLEIGLSAHKQLVDGWLGEQVDRLHREIERKDCDAAGERYARMQRLLPDDPRLPARLADCSADKLFQLW